MIFLSRRTPSPTLPLPSRSTSQSASRHTVNRISRRPRIFFLCSGPFSTCFPVIQVLSDHGLRLNPTNCRVFIEKSPVTGSRGREAVTIALVRRPSKPSSAVVHLGPCLRYAPRPSLYPQSQRREEGLLLRPTDALYIRAYRVLSTSITTTVVVLIGTRARAIWLARCMSL